MTINTKYRIGDEVYIIRNNRMEKTSISDYHLTKNGDSLEERVRYVVSPNPDKVLQAFQWYTDDDKRKEEEIFISVEDALNFIKNEYFKTL